MSGSKLNINWDYDLKGYVLYKNNLFDRMANFIEINDFNKRNFYRNASSLKVFYDKKLGDYTCGRYSVTANNIFLNSKNMMDSVSIHELFHMASNNTNRDGVGVSNEKDFGVSMDEGICDYLVLLFNNKNPSNIGYNLQAFVVDLLVYRYSLDILKPYFDNDHIAFIRQFDRELILSLMKYMDEYLYAMKKYMRLKNNAITKKYLNLKIKLCVKNISNAVSNLVLDNDLIKEEGLDNIIRYYNDIMKRYYIKDLSKYFGFSFEDILTSHFNEFDARKGRV